MQQRTQVLAIYPPPILRIDKNIIIPDTSRSCSNENNLNISALNTKTSTINVNDDNSDVNSIGNMTLLPTTQCFQHQNSVYISQTYMQTKQETEDIKRWLANTVTQPSVTS
jgi:hypothetical protein